MKKMIKKLAAVIIAALAAVAAIPCTKAAAADTFTVYTDVPDSWGNPSIWAWNNVGNIFDSSWPGMLMEEAENGWYSYEVPSGATNIIINDSQENGTIKTDDLAIDAVDMWIIVGDDARAEILYEAPEGAPGATEAETPSDTSAPVDETQSTAADNSSEGSAVIFNPLTIIIPAICVTAIIVILIVSICTNKKTDEE